MATRYVDPAASGSNDGTSWADAWTDFQSALDTATAGDIVYCRGTQTISTKIDADTNSGDTTSGHINFVGCDASGTANADQFILDANNAVANCIDINGAHRLRFENFTFRNATSHALYNDDGDFNIFQECVAEDSGGGGFLCNFNSESVTFFRCTATGNSSYGFQTPTYGSMHMCRSTGNGTGVRVYFSDGATISQCIFADNTADGIYIDGGQGDGCDIINCIVSGNSGDGIDIESSAMSCRLIGNIIVGNGGYGIRDRATTNESHFADFNAIDNTNTSGKRLNINAGPNDIDLTADPFVDEASGDYNINDTAGGGTVLRGETVTI